MIFLMWSSWPELHKHVYMYVNALETWEWKRGILLAALLPIYELLDMQAGADMWKLALVRD